MAKKNANQAARQMELRLIAWLIDDLHEGFNAVVDAYQDRLKRVAHNVLDDTPRLAHLAEDVVQDGLLNAFLYLRSNPDFLKDPALQLRNWLIKIVQNQALYCIKTGEAHIVLNVGVLGEEIEEVVEEGYITHYGDPLILLERWQSRMEAKRITRQQLATLSPEQRTAVEQKYLVPDPFDKEKTYEQVAKELGRPVGTVKSQIKRAKAQMRKQLIDQQAEQLKKPRIYSKKRTS